MTQFFAFCLDELWPNEDAWVHVEVEFDPCGAPPLRCKLNGREVEMQQVEPGVFRPKLSERAQ